MDSDAEAIACIGLAFLGQAACLQAQSATRRNSRKWWVRPWKASHKVTGAYHNLMADMRLTDPDSWTHHIRMSSEKFNELLLLVAPVIKKQDTQFRLAISPAEKLAVCLRYLATGESYASLACQFKIGKSTIVDFVPKVCGAIYRVLHAENLKFPRTPDEWKAIASDFNTWNFPHCLGAIDGKHVKIKKPRGGASYYHNYKGEESVVLLAVADANYRFLYINVGGNGRISDGGLFQRTALCLGLENGTLNLPEPELLGDKILPYVFVADNAFRLLPNLMKPYPFRSSTEEQTNFNFRLSRARRVVENAFGILSSKWRIYHTAISIHPESVDKVIMATCALHNYLGHNTCLLSAGQPGQRQYTMHPVTHNHSVAARAVRNDFCHYFNSVQGLM